jgi:hypothetical protein
VFLRKTKRFKFAEKPTRKTKYTCFSQNNGKQKEKKRSHNKRGKLRKEKEMYLNGKRGKHVFKNMFLKKHTQQKRQKWENK